MSKNSANGVDREPMPAIKKPYRTPRLTEYGHIARLTAGSTGSSTDKGTLANKHGQG
jgi:hypothetical protein